MSKDIHNKVTPTEMLSQRSRKLAPSLIREISEEAYGIKDIIPLWFGEGCWPTSDIAVEAVNKALRENDHFYQPNSGKPQLREDICKYYEKVYNLNITSDRNEKGDRVSTFIRTFVFCFYILHRI